LTQVPCWSRQARIAKSRSGDGFGEVVAIETISPAFSTRRAQRV